MTLNMNQGVELFAVREAQRGDESAWHYLFQANFEAVYRCSLSLTAGRQDAAEEITQQVFVVAARRIAAFRSKRGTFRAWLIGIAKNVAARHRSKKARKARQAIRDSEIAAEQNNDHPPSQLVHEVLAHLPEHYRTVLEAKYFEGLTVQDIAQGNDWTLKATESLLGRARRRFREVYSELQD